MSKGDKLYNKALKLALQEKYDPKEVIKILQTAIDKYNNGKAAYALSTWFFFGKHVRKNYKKGFELLKMSMEFEPGKDICYNIAICYEKGKGTKKDLQKAFYYYLLASFLDDKQAKYEVGRCIYYGIGINKNEKIGLKIINLFPDLIK